MFYSVSIHRHTSRETSASSCPNNLTTYSTSHKLCDYIYAQNAQLSVRETWLGWLTSLSRRPSHHWAKKVKLLRLNLTAYASISWRPTFTAPPTGFGQLSILQLHSLRPAPAYRQRRGKSRLIGHLIDEHYQNSLNVGFVSCESPWFFLEKDFLFMFTVGGYELCCS